MKLTHLRKGLKSDKASRLVRAKSMGYDIDTIWYHGSRFGGFDRFKLSYAGRGVVGANRSGGIYFSTDRDAAKYFADEEYVERISDRDWVYDDIIVYGDNDKYYFTINRVNKGPYPTEEDAQSAAEVIVDKHNKSLVGDVVHHNENVTSYYLALKNSLVVDAMNKFRVGESTAKSKGYDSVIGQDIYDGDRFSTVVVVFDPSIIRSTDAMFDPDKIDSDNIKD